MPSRTTCTPALEFVAVVLQLLQQGADPLRLLLQVGAGLKDEAALNARYEEIKPLIGQVNYLDAIEAELDSLLKNGGDRLMDDDVWEKAVRSMAFHQKKKKG